MIVNHFNNNINILNIKPYCEWLTSKNKISGIIICRKEIETNTITDKNNSIIISLLNNFLLSTYLKQLGISIIKFVKNCIIINYLDFELKLYIYPYDYDITIRNLKFECSKYSVNDKIQEHLLFFIDENWDLLREFTEDNKTDNYFKIDKVIPNLAEVILN